MTDLADERTNGPADHTPAGTAMDHVRPTLGDLAAADERTRRAVLTAEQKVRTADAAADRQVRTKTAHVRLAREERQVRQTEKAEQRRTRQRLQSERTAGRRSRRDEATAKLRANLAARADYARRNAPAVYSAVIYGVAVAVAVGGQISVAAAKHWPLIYGVGMAVFVEGLALAMALTAHQQRMQRERALAPRILTWIAAGFAAGINWWAHSGDQVLAVVLAASSLAGITVWEIRSGAKHRPVLRDMGLLPPPPEQFGWRRWVRYPWSTYQAWSLDILTRVTPRGAVLLSHVDDGRQTARSRRAHRRLVRLARVAVLVSFWRGRDHAWAALDRLSKADPPTRTPELPIERKRTESTDRPPVPAQRVRPDPAPVPPAPDHTGEETDDEADPQRTEVRQIGSSNDERYLALVRAKYPEGVPTWTEVHNAIRVQGMADSKSRTGRVHKKIKAEREAADDTKEDSPAYQRIAVNA